MCTKLQGAGLLNASIAATADCGGGGFASVDGGAGCFRAFCNASTWRAAEQVCQAHGAHLARLATWEQSFFARCLAAPRGDTTTPPALGAWIGLNSRTGAVCGKASPAGAWTWAGGGASAGSGGLLLWQAGEPNNAGGNERCAAVGRTGMWLDVNCGTPMPFVCSRPATSDSSSGGGGGGGAGAQLASCRHANSTGGGSGGGAEQSVAPWGMAIAALLLLVTCAPVFLCCTKRSWAPVSQRAKPSPPVPPGQLSLGVPLACDEGGGAHGWRGAAATAAPPAELSLLPLPGAWEQPRKVPIPPGLSAGDQFLVPLRECGGGGGGGGGGGAAAAAAVDHFWATVAMPPNAVPGQLLTVDVQGVRMSVTVPPGSTPGALLQFAVPQLPAAAPQVAAAHARCCLCCCRTAALPGEQVSACCGLLPGFPHSARAIARGRRVPTASFDAIRGFAALQVAIGHFFAFWRRGADATEWGGGNAVLMFFIMSGFVMMLGYGGKGAAPAVSGGYGGIARSFLLRRVARMGPTVWFALLINVPLSATAARHAAAADACSPDEQQYYDTGAASAGAVAWDYLATAAFVQTWVGAGATNGPLWSTCAQMFCYLLFPFFVGALHTVRNRARALGEALLYWWLYVALWLGQAALVGKTTGSAETAYLVAHVTPVNKIGLFLLGMLCGSLALTNAALAPSERADQRARRWGAVADGCLACVALYFGLGLVLGAVSGELGGFVRFCGELFMPPLYALWLFSLTQAPGCASARLLCWRPFRALGDWSFALYCLHFPLFSYYAWARFGTDWFVASRADELGKGELRSAELLPMLALLFAASWATHHGVEKPCRVRLAAVLERCWPDCGPCGRADNDDGEDGGAAGLGDGSLTRAWQAAAQRAQQPRSDAHGGPSSAGLPLALPAPCALEQELEMRELSARGPAADGALVASPIGASTL